MSAWTIPPLQKPIGVFDSGIGGLTVVRALMQRLPHENIVYFGDTARVPYGSKSEDVVREYAIEDASFLIEQGVKMIVVACNTVSAIALDDLTARFDVPVVGMIRPGARAALEASATRRVGVIGTLATIASRAYTRALHEVDGATLVVPKACPLFVPLAEEGWGTHPVATMVAAEYLAGLRIERIDTLILGCTHYPILRDVIRQAIGDDVALIDSGEAAAAEVEAVLAARGDLNDSPDQPSSTFYVSDVPQQFKQLGEIFLGRKDLRVQRVGIAGSRR
jgi:glutamate racemase